MPSTIFLTGSTGFIAQHIVTDLVAKGYPVIGTVRSTEKGDRLKKNAGELFSYEVVPDIQVEGAFDEALKKHPEIDIVLHTASPFHFKSVDHERDLLFPAVNGTKTVLAAIKAHAPPVKHVVLTSLYASIGTANLEVDPKQINTEQTWNQITWEEAKSDPVSAYRGLKTFAEKAAWEFLEKEKPNFTLTAINPVFVFGPQAFNSEVSDTLNTSAEVINSLLKLKVDDTIPTLKGGFCDVRDVSKAHIAGFENNETYGKRLLIHDSRFTPQHLLDILHKNFPELDGKIPKGVPGDKEKYDVESKFAKIDNSWTKKTLGWEFVHLEKSTVDTVQQVKDVKGKL